jgi:hypothetical protein
VAQDLLNAMEASPDFQAALPSHEMSLFLDRIEKADPNDTTLSEDDKGSSWGHYQFTAGSMSCTSVMKTWKDVGNTATACKLIAASLRTCKIARFVCKKTNIISSSYLADAYLERVVDTLWELWKAAGGVSYL